MKTTTKALSLKAETVRVLDDSQLTDVNGGNAARSRINSVYICVSNAGNGNVSCGNCGGAAAGGGEAPAGAGAE